MSYFFYAIYRLYNLKSQCTYTHIKGALASKFVFGGAIGWTSPFLTGANFLKTR